jgi:hypothetical protein
LPKNRHISATKGLPKIDIPVFFSEKFAPINRQNSWFSVQKPGLIGCFDLERKKASSLPYAPWGSIWKTAEVDYRGFEDWKEELIQLAREQKIETIVIKHPPSFYQGAISHEWIQKVGFEKVSKEINQHLDLTNPITLHEMEKRKLTKSQDTITVHSSKNWQQVYTWLQEWRTIQNIPLNIEWDHLQYLTNAFPDRYESWMAKWNDIEIALCITVKVTSQHIYYFLPATHPDYRQMSPMVVLLHHMANHYAHAGYNWFDLGQSSIEGIRQNGLYQFKKRMGAFDSEKIIYELDLIASL